MTVQFVPLQDPVRISCLTLRTTSARVRQLSVTAFAAWVPGPPRGARLRHGATDLDPETGAIFARTPYATAFRGRNAAGPACILAEHTDVGDREGMTAVLLSCLGVFL